MNACACMHTLLVSCTCMRRAQVHVRSLLGARAKALLPLAQCVRIWLWPIAEAAVRRGCSKRSVTLFVCNICYIRVGLEM